MVKVCAGTFSVASVATTHHQKKWFVMIAPPVPSSSDTGLGFVCVGHASGRSDCCFFLTMSEILGKTSAHRLVILAKKRRDHIGSLE